MGEIASAHRQAAIAQDATGQAEDRELTSDVRTFLNQHQDMNATPEVFAAHHAPIIAANQSKEAMSDPNQPPKDQGRER